MKFFDGLKKLKDKALAPAPVLSAAALANAWKSWRYFGGPRPAGDPKLTAQDRMATRKGWNR